MNLDFKKAIKDVFNLKYFWFYLIIFAILTTLSSILQFIKGLPHNDAISNIVLIFTYIATGCLYLMTNKILNNKDINSDDENFGQNLWNCTKKGLKCFAGILLNSIAALIVVGSFMMILAVLFLTKFSMPVPVFWTILGFVFILFAVYMFFVVNMLAVAFCEKFALKDMFCWRKVLKNFFKKGNVKETLTVSGIYVVLFFLIMALFLINLFSVGLFQAIFGTDIVTIAIGVEILNIIIPFVAAMLSFILSGFTLNLFAQIYKRNITSESSTAE